MEKSNKNDRLKSKIFKYNNVYKLRKRGKKMDWIIGLGALFCSGSSLILYFQQYFFISFLSFTLAIVLALIFENKSK